LNSPWKTINHRYVALRELSRSSGSAVFLARDTQAGDSLIALKTLRLDRADAWQAARREFELLRQVHHPRIAKVFSLGKVEAMELPNGSLLTSPDDDAAPPAAAGARAGAGRFPRPGDAFLTFEYVDGLNLREGLLRLFPTLEDRGSAERWTVFSRILARALEALAAIHARNLVHQDIKPENILLVPMGTASAVVFGDAGSRDFEVRIIDFGFAQEETTPVGARIRGTVPYIAPELLTGSFADGRSDLYSLGISILHALSGRFPFPVHSMEAWIGSLRSHSQLHTRPLLEGVPEPLASAIESMVALDPRQRPRGAAALVDELENAAGGPLPALTEAGRAPSRLPSCGWSRQLEILRGEVEAVARGEARHPLTLIESEEGSYAEAFAEELKLLASLSECQVARSRAHLPTLRPLDALSGLLIELLERHPPRSPPFRRFQSAFRWLDAAADGPTDAGADLSTPRETQAQFTEELASFLVLAGQVRPLVVILEELQNADEDTLAVLEALARRLSAHHQDADESTGLLASSPRDAAAETAAPEAHAAREKPYVETRVLIIGFHRQAHGAAALGQPMDLEAAGASEAQARLASLLELPFCQRLRLQPLDLQQLRDWIAARHPKLRLADKWLRRVQEISGGVPRLVDAILARTEFRGPALAGGANPDRPASFELGAGDYDLVEDSLSLGLAFGQEEWISESLRGVTGEERAALEALAVATTPLRRDAAEAWLGRIRDLDAVDADAILRALEAKNFIASLPSAGGAELIWVFEHARTRFYKNMDKRRRESLHGLFLETVVGAAPPPPSEEALHHALRAGRQGAGELALQVADRYFRCHAAGKAIAALESVLQQAGFGGDLDPTDAGEARASGDAAEALDSPRAKILFKLGCFYRSTRQLNRALEKLTVLLSLEGSRSNLARRSEVYRLTGEIYQENGDLNNALYFLEKSFQILDSQPPSALKVEAALSLSKLLVSSAQLQRAETLAHQALGLVGKAGDADLQIRLHLHLGALYGRLGDFQRSVSFHLRALEVARAHGEMARALEATESLGAIYLVQGGYEKAVEYFTRGMELATLAGSKKTLAKIYSHLGNIHFNRAQHASALENFQRSLQLYKEIEDRRGIANSYNNIGLALCLKDDLARASVCFRRAIEIFTQLGDEHGQAAGMNNLALIHELEGRYQDALEYAFRSLEKRKRFQSKSGIAFSYYRIGKICQARGELDKAVSYAEKALQIRREIGEKMGLAYSEVQIADLLLFEGRLGEALSRCDEGETGFALLENAYGKLLASETKARILIQLGDLDNASQILQEVLAQARQGDQSWLSGRALLDLARIQSEHARFRDAELQLDQAEAIFSKNKSRRELAEIHLERCRLLLDEENPHPASQCLEKAYEILEEIGIRDLVPHYFLLRGRLESTSPTPDLSRIQKFYERALKEARELCLPQVLWEVQLHLGLLKQRAGDAVGSREHLFNGLAVLETLAKGLPPAKKERFLSGRRHRQLHELCSSPKPAAAEDADVAPTARGKRGALPLDRVEQITDDLSSKLLAELQEVKALNRRLLKLQEITRAITSELDLRRLLEKAIDMVLELMNGERGYLLLKVAGKDAPKEVFVARDIRKQSLAFHDVEISRSISDEVLRTGQPILSTNALLDSRFTLSQSVKDLQLLSVICAPLRSQGEILGCIYLDNRQRKHAFAEGDLRVLESYCEQATSAIVNAHMAEEIQGRNRELIDVNQQLEALNQRLVRELEHRTNELQSTREQMREKLNEYETHLRLDNIVGKSRKMQEIFRVLKRVAPTALPVLVQGESGTGKELIARAIHDLSDRKDRKFISENCAALSESLLESELFGHTRGAFTGATTERKGLFELAHGGTLFLDEVADMSLAMQKKLLRVLEDGGIRRVGGKESVQVDVRLISASNRDLRQLVDEGRFREDLFYRLNGVSIVLPSLRDRKEDIPLLVQHFLKEIARESRQAVKAVTAEALRRLSGHWWPGNVRELKHFLERTVLLMEGDVLDGELCSIEAQPLPPKLRGGDGSGWGSLMELSLRQARERFLKAFVEQCYVRHGRNVTRAADACGMSRESFHRFLRRFRLNQDDEQTPPRRGAGPGRQPPRKPRTRGAG
jgi:transcriptional regulator with GAF, ATPase, and Fis domain/serine/threonine protein kinase